MHIVYWNRTTRLYPVVNFCSLNQGNTEVHLFVLRLQWIFKFWTCICFTFILDTKWVINYYTLQRCIISENYKISTINLLHIRWIMIFGSIKSSLSWSYCHFTRKYTVFLLFLIFKRIFRLCIWKLFIWILKSLFIWVLVSNYLLASYVVVL